MLLISKLLFLTPSQSRDSCGPCLKENSMNNARLPASFQSSSFRWMENIYCSDRALTVVSAIRSTVVFFCTLVSRYQSLQDRKIKREEAQTRHPSNSHTEWNIIYDRYSTYTHTIPHDQTRSNREKLIGWFHRAYFKTGSGM